MKRDEFSKITLGLKTAYPRFKFLESTEELDFWYRMLADIDFEIIKIAVYEHISTNIYPPSISELRKLCADKMFEPVKSYEKAFVEVMKAVSRYGMYNMDKAIESLDKLTSEAVKEIGFQNICLSENTDFIKSRFKSIYEKKAERIGHLRQLPRAITSCQEELMKLETNSENSTELKINIVYDTEPIPMPEHFKKQMNDFFKTDKFDIEK